MRFNDAVFGTIFILFAIVEILYARSFPALHGQQFGASDFPILIGIGLGICGAILVVRGLKQRYGGAIVGGALVSVSDWIENNAAVTNFVLVLLGILFFIFALDGLGFVPTALLMLLVLFKRFGNSWAVSVGGAAILTGATKILFGEILLVPLPTGPLGF